MTLWLEAGLRYGGALLGWTGRRTMRAFAIAFVAAFAAGCAASPASIAPAYVSELQFQQYSCEQIAAEQSRIEAALAASSAQQNRARSNDAWGVALLGLPVSTLSGGNVADQIAHLKGTQNALAKAATLKNCAVS